jgi:hypothetical protein
MHSNEITRFLRIQCMSDLHLGPTGLLASQTRGRPSLERPDADLILVAGDVGSGIESIQRLRSVLPTKPIVMVAGNHEHYGLWWHNATDLLREEARKHDIVFLENESWDFSGVRFHGCTFWTDFEYDGIEHKKDRMVAMGRLIKDYQKIGAVDGARLRQSIRCSYRDWELMQMLCDDAGFSKSIRQLRTKDVVARHQESRSWLRSQLDKDPGLASVVITHHLPHEISVDPLYQDDIRNAAFVSRCDSLFALPGAPGFWVHGHTHHKVNALVHRTRLVCNPMGHRQPDGSNQNIDFDPWMVIEVPIFSNL